jgi:hypothetical protein
VLPPGKIFAMLSVTDSIVEVASFYTLHSLQRCLKVGLEEIGSDAGESDTAYLAAEAFFHGLLLHFSSVLAACTANLSGDEDEGR